MIGESTGFVGAPTAATGQAYHEQLGGAPLGRQKPRPHEPRAAESTRTGAGNAFSALGTPDQGGTDREDGTYAPI